MTHVRQVTGTIHKPDGSPWPEFAIGFDVPKTAATTHATLPGTSVGAGTTAHTIVTQTNASGEFSVDLEVDVTIRVTMLGALVTAGTSTRYPGDAQFPIVVPDGDTPITMQDIIAANNTPVTPTLLGRVLPEGGTAGQALVKASDDDYAAEWGDVDGGGGGAAAWGSIGGTLADQTDLADALASKADTDSLGSAAYTDATAYATAAQGGLADSAVQPEALADVATSGAYSDLTGTPAIPTVPATIVESVTAGDNVTVDASDPAHPVVSASGGGVELAGDGTAETAARSDHEHTGSGGNSVALGPGASAGHSWTVALGADASAAYIRSIAIGWNAQANASYTAVIKANDLDVQRSNGTGETRLSLYSPNGTKYWLTVDDTGTIAATPA